MKTVCLFILTLVVLYNPKVQARDAFPGSVDVLEMADAEYTINHDIVLKKKNPLKDINENLESYTLLMKLFKDYQSHNLVLANELLTKLSNNKTFSGDDLYMIKKSFDIFYKLNSKMTEFGTVYQFKHSTMSRTFASPEIKRPMVKSHLIWLSSNLMVIDHMTAIHKIVYEKDGSFRRIFKNSVNNADLSAAEKLQLKELVAQVAEVKDTVESFKFLQQITLVRSIEAELRASLSGDTNALMVLDEVIANPASKDIAEGKTKFELRAFGLEDAAVGTLNKITNWLSGVFGNIAGSIKWRKGYLFENKSAIDIAKSSLRPMDIILEKTPFILTDKLIPGHYGHVAIYLGTKEQLLEINMWNHPDIIPYQDLIESGNTILEAVRSGVRMNSVEEFMNVDEMIIIRKDLESMPPDMIAEQIRRGMDQMGKPYDFNFDISTLDKLVCSEMVYIMFGNVSWPTRYRVGRPTITPDDIAEVLFYKNTKLKLNKYMISTKRQTMETLNISNLADLYEFELRAENGGVITDPQDSTNSFWKKDTKCYNLEDSVTKELTKTCRTTYKEYYYEEVGH